MDILLIELFLLFMHSLNKMYPKTFYDYPGCSILISILLFLLILLGLLGLLLDV